MNKVIHLFIVFMLAIYVQEAYAQSVGINNSGASPFTSAMLDVSSTSKGILIPRMTVTQRLAISPLTEGLIVYQTDGDEGFHYYDGASWVKLNSESPIWSDEGSYLTPLGAIGPGLRVADDETYQYGFFSDMNTGSSTGYGGYFNHTNTSGATYGIYAGSSYTGADNNSYSYGAYIFSNSSTQDQKGIYNYNQHTGSSGYLIGIENYSQLTTGNSTILTGIKNVSVRDGSESSHYGIYSQAVRGTNVYGLYASASSGTSNYGLYGVAETASNSYGLYARGESWGGWLANNSSGKSVKLAGSTYALQIQDGNEASGKVLASDESGNASWQSLPPVLWTDQGAYLSPINPDASGILVADDTTHTYGFKAEMNTGGNYGYGGYFSHTSNNSSATGLYASAAFTGSTDYGFTIGADINATSSYQEVYGIRNIVNHTGAIGYATGIYSLVNVAEGNYAPMAGILSVSNHSTTNVGSNEGISSSASYGSEVYGISGSASSGITNYGIYGISLAGTNCYGVYGKGDDWGGYFEHASSGNEVKLGGDTYAIAAGGDINLNSLSNAYQIGTYDVLHFPNGDYSNIGLGVSTGPGITAYHNSYFGYQAGSASTSVWDNTFIGYKAGVAVTDGDQNTFLGSWAGSSQLDGDNNTFLGYHAGAASNSPSNNTYLGAYAGNNNVSGSGNVFLGYSAGFSEMGSNKLYIHNSSGSSPLVYGDFNDSTITINGIMSIGSFLTPMANLSVTGDKYFAGYFTSGLADENTHILHAEYVGSGLEDVVGVFGSATMPSNSQHYGIGGMFYGNYTGVHGKCITNGSGTISYAVIAENGMSGSLGIKYGLFGFVNGNVGEDLYAVYGSAPVQTSSYALYCEGNGVYTGTWSNTSDEKLKKNINVLGEALEMVMELEPRSFEFRRNEFDFINLAEGKHYGFVAQELQDVLPELVGSATQPMSDEKNPQIFEYKTTNTIELIPILTRAIQEQQELIMSQQNQINTLQERIDRLESR